MIDPDDLTDDDVARILAESTGAEMLTERRRQHRPPLPARAGIPCLDLCGHMRPAA